MTMNGVLKRGASYWGLTF